MEAKLDGNDTGNQRYPVREPIRVRWKDLDPLGHVNNAVYFTYFEMGRVAYMRALGHVDLGAAQPSESFPFIIAKLSCEFLAPVGLEDELEIALSCTQLGSKSFQFRYRLTRLVDGREVARGDSVQVYYDYPTKRSAPLPQEFRARVEALEAQAR